MNSTNKIINVFLVIAVTLGVICLVFIYLPDTLSSHKLLPKENTTPESFYLLPPIEKNVQKEEPKIKIIGTYAKFTPKKLKVKREDVESKTQGWLTVPDGIKDEFNFWLKIYSKYSSDEIVLHDTKYMHVIYGVVSISDIVNNEWLTDEQKKTETKKRIEASKDLIRDTLTLLDKNPTTEELTPKERRIRFLFPRIDEPKKYKNALGGNRLRAQVGQRDKFAEAIKLSGEHFDKIEKIFKNYNLPKELTRLIFVESMFVIEAQSFVGALGLWQFMENTGKIYLNMNSYVDERLDPYKAAHAAAQLLLDNYEYVGMSWPLAINAYNAGKGRLRDARNRLGTSDISTIIKKYDHPAYGFAARNFFPEFLAAVEAYKNYPLYFGEIEKLPPLEYDIVELNYHIMLPEVLPLTQIDPETIKKLNPALSNHVMTGELYLPKGFKLRIPKGKSDLFLALCARAAKSHLGEFYHRVYKGDNLQNLSRLFGITPEDIKIANNLKGSALRPGQLLVIPVGDSTTEN